MGKKRLVSFTRQCSTTSRSDCEKVPCQTQCYHSGTPSLSPDLGPADLYMFARLKMKLKGHRFVDSDEMIENATKQLKDLSKNGFQECFEQIYERWKKCMDAGGKYFEGQ
ncbi:hypothetical protein AVEN_251759-1 [Araneus ventricosus]|uniref:Histone-lysine N-methyltransferase SETMAR n=1 Tax=Araneus ventricosus TaxID=182803 RepID=A0A4Y2MGL3_ARAVE|nr:hypothetical protein AVEN_251759-1 [Araneus ventricosus]